MAVRYRSRLATPGVLVDPGAQRTHGRFRHGSVVVAKRSADITVTVNKEGYEPQVIPLTKEIPGTGAAGFAGNVLVGGLVGMGVDAYTGAAQDHKPNPVTVTLQPLTPAQPRPAKPRPPKRPPPPQS